MSVVYDSLKRSFEARGYKTTQFFFLQNRIITTIHLKKIEVNKIIKASEQWVNNYDRK